MRRKDRCNLLDFMSLEPHVTGGEGEGGGAREAGQKRGKESSIDGNLYLYRDLTSVQRWPHLSRTRQSY